MPNPKKGQFDLSDVREFLENFAVEVNRDGSSDLAKLTVIWGRRDQTLLVSRETASEYRQLLKRVQQHVAPLDDLSEKALDSALKDAHLRCCGRD